MKEVKKRQYNRRCDVNYVPKEHNPEDLAYLAGIIDGEGCFFIGKLPVTEASKYKTEHYRGLLKIETCSLILHQWLLDTFSGTESTAMRKVKPHLHKQATYAWVATGDRLLNLCELVLPFLRIKKRHCEIMIKFRKTYEGKRLGDCRLSPETLAQRDALLREIRPLNSKYHLHPLKHPESK
jgi:hypothetical protein